MLLALVVAVTAVAWSVGSPGSGSDVSSPTVTSPTPSSTPSSAPAPAPAPTPTDLADGETWFGDVHLSSVDVVTGDGDLSDVTAVGSDVTLTADGLRAGRLELDATLPFDTAAAQIGGGVSLYAVESGLAGLRRRVSVLGRDVEVRATGTVRAVDGRLVIEPETVDLDGPDWLDSAASTVVRQLVTVRHTVEGVPDGMALTSVSVHPGGFRAHLRGDDVAITR
jgi:hypothetical protein